VCVCVRVCVRMCVCLAYGGGLCVCTCAHVCVCVYGPCIRRGAVSAKSSFTHVCVSVCVCMVHVRARVFVCLCACVRACVQARTTLLVRRPLQAKSTMASVSRKAV
jgi:hypothetical protein